MCWLGDDHRRREALLREDPLSPEEQGNRPLEVRIGVKKDVGVRESPLIRKGNSVNFGKETAILELNCGYKCDL